MINTTNEFITKTNETTKIFKQNQTKNTKIITKSNDKVYKKTKTNHNNGSDKTTTNTHTHTDTSFFLSRFVYRRF